MAQRQVLGGRQFKDDRCKTDHGGYRHDGQDDAGTPVFLLRNPANPVVGGANHQPADQPPGRRIPPQRKGKTRCGAGQDRDEKPRPRLDRLANRVHGRRRLDQVIDTPRSRPNPKVTAAAASPIASWRRPEKARLRPVKMLVTAPVANNARALTTTLAITALWPCSTKNGTTGNIAPIMNTKNEDAAADQAEPPSSCGLTPISSRTSVSSASCLFAITRSAVCCAAARSIPLD